ncbi:MAG: hypothetical protein IT373_32580 [Polyangiaceae bacterium]|nr:hypothetical protein [Polyangiaceae bacterium]
MSKLSPREQRMLAVLGLLFGLFLVIGLPVFLFLQIKDARAQNEAFRKALRQIDRADEALGEQKKKRDSLALRYASPAPPLGALIESAAQANGIDVPESKDRPTLPRGKRYTERMTVVKLRNVGLLALGKTLERIEQSGHPVSITLLHVKPRSEGPDAYDVDLGVSAYDKKGGEAEGPAPSTGAPDGGADAGVARPPLRSAPTRVDAGAPDAGASSPPASASTRGQPL